MWTWLQDAIRPDRDYAFFNLSCSGRVSHKKKEKAIVQLKKKSSFIAVWLEYAGSTDGMFWVAKPESNVVHGCVPVTWRQIGLSSWAPSLLVNTMKLSVALAAGSGRWSTDARAEVQIFVRPDKEVSSTNQHVGIGRLSSWCIKKSVSTSVAQFKPDYRGGERVD